MTKTRGALIVVGVDGSEASRHALRWAVAQAELSGAELVALTAWHLPEMYGYVSRDYDVDAANMLESVLKEVLDPPPPVTVRSRVVEGGAASVLIEASKDADLLVVGTRGRGGFEGMLLGSVSQHAVQHAACPVVVVPGPWDRTEGHRHEHLA